MPGNMAGGPPGPGAPLPTTAGIGAGNEAGADALINAILPTLHRALTSYPAGSKKYMAVLHAIKSLAPTFEKGQTQGLVPAGILQMAQMAKQGGPMAGAPPPPLAAQPPKGMPNPMEGGAPGA